MFRRPQRRRLLDDRRSNNVSVNGDTATFKQQGGGGGGGGNYPTRLNMYLEPPLDEMTVDEFEVWGLDRLRVLGELESCMFRNKTRKETEVIIKPLLDKYLPLSSSTSKASDCQMERKKDHYSHFILRLSFCRSPELRARFVRAESLLFKIRFGSDDSLERRTFINSLNFDWDIVDENEKQALSSELCAACQLKSVDNESFFKVDFERVVNLVEIRQVYLRNGKAYVPSSQQQSLVFLEFEASLTKSLEVTARLLPRLDEDNRLIPILNHMAAGFTEPEYNSFSTGDADEVSAAQVDSLVGHFPLCMRNLHMSLRRDHHLKYFGRQQYGLFLKGIGLSVEEALVFWRKAFDNITDDKFNKDYRYNIRHNYGLEGARKNYQPLSCQRILLENKPGPGDAHGCPYRHFSVNNLVAALNGMGVSDSGVIANVKEDVAASHYHVACTRVFEYTHRSALSSKGSSGAADQDHTITHPNQYFARSLQLSQKPKVEVTMEN